MSLEVGTEGILGGQAVVKDVGGTWKDLTDNVNMMASKITNQVRDIAVVAKAVARGDLSKKVKANAQGEVLELKNTMNKMVKKEILIKFNSHSRHSYLHIRHRWINLYYSQQKSGEFRWKSVWRVN